MNDVLPEVEGYRVLRSIGQGGVGRVFLAETVSKPERRVALKLLNERIDFRQNDVRRLIREARVGSSLHHRNILPVLSIEPWRDSHVIVMEYVDGSPLRPWQADREPPSALGERVLVLASIADALHYAHSLGVVHRDIKPANILVRGDGHPFLIDFGLARTIAVDSTVTATGTILGTPGYLPPEQVAGAGTLDQRSDLYALGVTLYEVATGTLPFRAANLPDLFEQILHQEPPSLRATTPHARALEPIVRRAMEKRPSDRYGSAGEMRDDLQRAARGLKPRSGTASLWVRRELRRISRRRLQLVLGAAGVLALATAVLFFGLRSERLSRERGEKLQQGYQQLDSGKLDAALSTFAQVDQLSPSGHEGSLARANALAEFQMWGRARTEIQNAVALGYDFGGGQPTSEDLFLRGLQEFTDHRYAESEVDLRAALAHDPNQYRAYFVISLLLLREERRAEAVQILETCRRNLKEVNPRHTAVSALIHVLVGEYGEAVAALRRLAETPDAPSWVHPLLGYAYLASFHEGARQQEDLRLAEAEFTRAVELEAGDGYSWSQLGVACLLAGKPEEADRAARRAVELDPKLEPGLRLLAILAAQRGEWEIAESHLRAFADETALSGLASTLQAQAAYESGKKSFDSGDYAKAIEPFERCVALLPRHLAGWLLLGQSRWVVGKTETALEAFRECRARLEAWVPPPEEWEPWVRSSEAVRHGNALDLEIGLFGTTVELGRTPSEAELGSAAAALERLQAALTGGAELAPASALNLAEALATSRVEELRDCAWARELVETGKLREFFVDSAARAILERIGSSCP